MSKTSTLLDLLCANRRQMRFFIALLVAMGIFLALSALYVTPGDRAYPILVVDAVMVVGGLLFLGGLHWYCTKRAMED